MPSTYSPNLRIELIASGEQGNTWGGTTNNNLGTLIENAISGTVSIDSMPSNTYTLTVLNGANDNARNMYIKVTAGSILTAAGTIIAPAVSKMYVVTNGSLGGYAITLKTASSTGISIPNGATRTVFYNGTDFVDVVTATNSLLLDGNATQNLQAVTKQQMDAALALKISKDGSIAMTQPLILSSSTLNSSSAATTATPKGYVDSFVPLAGNATAMTGPLTLYSTDPTGYQATSRTFTDFTYVAKTGSTMTGALTLYSFVPTGTWQAVPKSYVDNVTVTSSNLGIVTGTNVNGSPTVAVTLNPATTSALGGVKQGSGCTIAGDGTLNINATATGITAVAGTLPISVNTVGGTATVSISSTAFYPYSSNTYLTTSGTAADSSKLGGTAAASYATQSWVTSQGYLTSVPAGTATQTYVQNYSVYKGGDSMSGALNVKNSSSPAKYVTVDTVTTGGNYYPALIATNTSGSDFAALALGQLSTLGTYNTPVIFTAGTISGTPGSPSYGSASHSQFNYDMAVFGNIYGYYNSSTGVGGNITIPGTISAGTKSFRIPHPTVADKDLVHIAVESPRADMFYRGVVKLTDGYATVEIDANSNMTDGTFASFTQNVEVVALRNKDGFTRVKASEVVQGTFHITAEDATCTDNIAWMVVAERADPFMKELNLTDINGRLIPEQTKILVREQIIISDTDQSAGA